MITNKIKEYRKNKRLTQDELASELDVSRKTINLIESGKLLPKIDLVYKLSLILDEPIENLFYNEKYYEHSQKQKEKSFEEIASTYFNFKINS
ncbi:MAG: helix-turn-helix transcriptional regulator [Bacilli bacterium]|nr:helix-turn-helix transcriptional regulator [Bacilli bacterium]MDD4282763.1 helix-turn-helix transcriptional regulator [Bacilli bacterium]MDD4718379.1 helix-turn-helix transcriptional regulator [Bacilli bacterium]